MRASISLTLLVLIGCSTANGHCPPKTAAVFLQCKQDIAKGLKTKTQCYQEIEESCP